MDGVIAPWFGIGGTPAGRVQLVCFPYAGGGPEMFRSWPSALPDVGVHAVLLPGRGRRLDEPLVTDSGILVPALAEQLAPCLRPPFCLFGYSLGAHLAFELAGALAERGRGPARVVVAASRAPAVASRIPAMAGMADDEFLSWVYRHGGTPPEVLANDELRSLALPILRADFQLFENLAWRPRSRLTVPLTAIAGTRDALLPIADVMAWSRATSGPFSCHFVDGGHFFIKSHEAQVLEIVRQEAARAAGGSAPASATRGAA